METFLKRMLAIIVFLSRLAFVGYGSEANTQGGCVEHASLEVSRQGMVKCGLNNFYSLSWYRKDDYDAEHSPFISYSNGEKYGQLHQYDVLANGSLTIGNVSANDAGSYIVTVLEEIHSPDIIFLVRVEVSDSSLPSPPPADPVITGCSHQLDKCVLITVEKELSCTVRNSQYKVDLHFEELFRHRRLDFEESRVTRRQTNNLFVVSITAPFRFRDESMMQGTVVKCVASRSDSGLYVSSATALVQYNAGKVDGDVGRSDILSNVLPTAVLSIITIGGVIGLYCRLLQVEKKVQRVQKSIDQVWTVTESGRSIVFDSGQNNSETQEVHTLSDRNEQVSDKGQTVDSDTENNQFPKEAVFQLTDVSHGQASVKMGCSSEEDLVGNMEGKRLLAPQCVTTSQPVAGTVPEGHSNHF